MGISLSSCYDSVEISFVKFLPSQVTPYRKRKPCRPTINKPQVVTALVVGYVHSHLIPSVVDIQFALQPTHRSTDCHYFQFPTTALTDTFEIVGLTCLSTLCQDDHFYEWTLSGWNRACLLTQHTHSLGVQLFS